MRVYVINMKKHADRRTATIEKLSAVGIEFEFFDAITGEEAIERELFDAIDEDEFLLNTGRKITPGEIGCYASHRELWRQCGKLDQSFVIMEDDFKLLDGFVDALMVAESIIDQAGFIRLQTDLRAKKKKVITVDEFELCRFTKPPHGLMCYCIAADVARRFVEATRVLDEPVDIFTKKYWNHGQSMYVLTPYTVTESAFHSATTISGRKKTKKPLSVAIRRFLRKAGAYLKRWRFNFEHRHDVPLLGEHLAEAP